MLVGILPQIEYYQIVQNARLFNQLDYIALFEYEHSFNIRCNFRSTLLLALCRFNTGSPLPNTTDCQAHGKECDTLDIIINDSPRRKRRGIKP
jgi:hypothetical protein